MNDGLIFHQLFEKETSTYTYVVADARTREAVIIDPVKEMVERDVKLIDELQLKLKYVLDTHLHADHITASGELRKRTGAKVGISSAYDLAGADLHLEDQQELKLGKFTLKALHTPGHTSGCMSYLMDHMIFTGDALLIRGCGRTDFQEGSSQKLFASVREKLFTLPDETIIYPAHDYKGFSHSTIGEEKKLNPRLNLKINQDEFVSIMANLKLVEPKKIKEAVPANQQCGIPAAGFISDSDLVAGVPTVTAEYVYGRLGHLKVIDVRGLDEFNNELGHIHGSVLATLGDPLEQKLAKENKFQDIVFVCRSGKRSAQATILAMHQGYEKVYNLEGGMLKWNELHLPVERDLAGS